MFQDYTKAELELVTMLLFENLSATNQLLRKISTQNKLLESMNKKLRDELEELKQKLYSKGIIDLTN